VVDGDKSKGLNEVTTPIAEGMNNQSSPRLTGRWLWAARVGWLALTAMVVWLWAAVEVLGPALEPVHIAYRVFLDGGFVLIALIIFWRKSDEVMGLLVSLMLVFLEPYLLSGVGTDWGFRPGWNVLSNVLVIVGGGVTVLCFYLFPNGQFVPRWTRFLTVGVFGLLFVAILADIAMPSEFPFSAQLFSVLAPIGILAQVYRYRRVSNPVQRQQTKWVVLGFLGPVVGFFLWLVSLVGGWENLLNQNLALSIFSGSLMSLLPIAIAFSILRYRLWDIDLLIRRTLVYSVITALLALIYFGSVVVLQGLFTAISGQQSGAAVVISTLGIAALFFPLRNWVQAFIDRRFYRRKYDAAKTLAAFATLARDETDLTQLTQRLSDVVEETMQPESVGVWLKNLDATPLRNTSDLRSEG
jgi:hypothetical protein